MEAGVEGEVGGANLDYVHFPELGSQSGLSLGRESSPLPSAHLPEPPEPGRGREGEDGTAALQPSREPLPLFLRLRGKADLLWGWVILLAR